MFMSHTICLNDRYNIELPILWEVREIVIDLRWALLVTMVINLLLWYES